MTIKVLPLPYWAKPKTHAKLKAAREVTLRNYTPIYPIFHREGYYKRDGISWIELEDGRAFIIPVVDFDLNMGILEASEWSDETKELIKACAYNKALSTPKIRRMYYLVQMSEPKNRKLKAKCLSVLNNLKK